MAAKRQVRYAVVGLGFISQAAMLPAFANARRNSALAALVSGDARKLRALGKRYGVEHRVDYEGFDALLAAGAVDAVFIGLPNTMHRDFAVRALAAGVHVLCDKPLATTVEDCRRMIDTARNMGTKLMTAYRLHFEPGNLEAMNLIHGGKLGEMRFFTSQFAQEVRAGNIRTKAELGGGPLFDLGIYCINAARHVFRDEPVEVYATVTKGRDERSAEVEETAQISLRFPGSRLASFTCTCSFGAADVASFQVFGSKGGLRLDRAYDMQGPKKLTVEIAGAKPASRVKPIPSVDQFAPELLHFSDCILDGRDPIASAEDGLADIRVVEAIRRSIEDAEPVELDALDFQGRPLSARNAARKPAHGKVKMVQAEPPSA